MDMSKLTPAPWGSGEFIATYDNDGKFITLARQAFDVMMRRKWRVCPVAAPEAWAVLNEKNVVLWRNNECLTAADPFTALVEADRWYAANVEGKNV